MAFVGASAVHVVVLAAGKGTRMKSARPKVLHLLAGRPVIDYVLRAVQPLGAVSTVLVIGHGGDEVRSALAGHAGLEFVVQSPQLGTGHALLQAEAILRERTGTVLLVYGDVPLLRSGTLARLVEAHHAAGAAATVLTTRLDPPAGYGRIVRDDAGRLVRIVEERDASAAERALTEINSGIYAFELAGLFDSLRRLAADNAQGEYYLTDLIGLHHRERRRLETVLLDSPDELHGVNTLVDLAELGHRVRQAKNREVMLAGATLEDPASTFIDEDVTVGADSVIGPAVRLEGRTTVGARCRIQAGVRLTNALLGDGATVLDHSVVVESEVANDAVVGPFSHIRPGSVVAERAHVGNFVELKKTRLGPGSKANHLTYLGDATIGAGVNIGAGTITCNFDGEQKNETVIEDDVFIGSDSQLIAPVRIGKGAYVAAGSSITDDVPEGALAIARGRQENKPEWAAQRKAGKRAKSTSGS
jgi:bifunctional UDP-N-acetylglucosamine pyrophosphorylase / glucosamine-1-phosphate N-acetyltransferase